MQLVIGNKNYSSWSMRPWVLMTHLGIPFTEKRIWLDTASARGEKLAHAPTARVPVLHDGDVTVWDSLAIIEYLAEQFPERGIWPEDERTRARARSLCAEMHSGFSSLRTDLPMNCRGRGARSTLREETFEDIDRILQIWTETPREFAHDGSFLFGRFCAADAFFAPVASRFLTYELPPEGEPSHYWRSLLALPAVQQWMDTAAKEPNVLDSVDQLIGV